MGTKSVVVMIGTLVLGAGVVTAKPCALEIEANDAMQYSTKEMGVAGDCTEVTLTLKHTGKLPKTAMGHNWVLVADADAAAILGVAIAAGAANEYVPKDDKRILAATKLIGGGETTMVTFATDKLEKGGNYTFLCTFPGHGSLMKGKLVYK